MGDVRLCNAVLGSRGEPDEVSLEIVRMCRMNWWSAEFWGWLLLSREVAIAIAGLNEGGGGLLFGTG